MTIDEAIRRYTDNAEYERTHGNLQGCLDFKQLAEWLKELKKLREKEPILDKIRAEIEEKYGDYDICEWFEDYDYEENNISEYRSVGDVSDILAIIDKYRSESEGIKALEQEPKTGHWIEHQEGRWIYAKCSNCGTLHNTQTNYCPTCGFAMERTDI